MENRPLSLAAGLIVLALLPLSALAGEAVEVGAASDWALRMDRAAALQAEARGLRSEADKVLAEKNLACHRKFFVNACLEENQAEQTVVVRQATRLENEAKSIELQVRKEQLSERDMRRQAEAPQRAAEREARAEETAAARSNAEAKAAATRAKKAIKAEEGAARKAAEEEKYRHKQQSHDARNAEKMQHPSRQVAKPAVAQP